MKTYLIRFTHRDSSELDEIYEHATEADARYHFGLFGPDDADIYSRLQLIESDWDTGTETLLETLEL